MKSLKVSDLKEGTMYSKPVYIDDINILVPERIPLKQKDIDRLVRWEIKEVFTEGTLVSESKDQKTEKASKFSQSLEGSEVYKLYASSIETFETILTRIKNNEKVEKVEIDSIAQNLLTVARDKTTEIVQIVLSARQSIGSLATSSVNSTIISIIIAIDLKFPSHKLLQLAIGALLHDTGMLKIPDEIIYKKGDLTPAELKLMRTHPIYSYKIITEDLGYPKEIGFIAVQHHERWDGEGYPKKTAGKDILIAARLVSVADAFEAMISERPYRNPMIGYAAMKNILSDNSRRFDPDILKVMIKSMGIYPIGSIVLLNNSAIGRVTEIHSDAPLRPKLKILIDEYGREYTDKEGPAVDLLEEKSIFIARAIDPQEMK